MHHNAFGLAVAGTGICKGSSGCVKLPSSAILELKLTDDVKSLAYDNYAESTEKVVSKEFEHENNYLMKKPVRSHSRECPREKSKTQIKP